MSLKNFSSSSINSLGVDGAIESKEDQAIHAARALVEPVDFVEYMKSGGKPQAIEVGKMHKLRVLLRTETVGWVDEFLKLDGMPVLVRLLRDIMQLEWR